MDKKLEELNRNLRSVLADIVRRKGFPIGFTHDEGDGMYGGLIAYDEHDIKGLGYSRNSAYIHLSELTTDDLYDLTKGTTDLKHLHAMDEHNKIPAPEKKECEIEDKEVCDPINCGNVACPGVQETPKTKNKKTTED